MQKYMHIYMNENNIKKTVILTRFDQVNFFEK